MFAGAAVMLIPRLFTARLAADYLGVSERSFERLWRSGRLPQPHRLGRRLLWDRKLLDGFVDELSGLIQAKQDDDW